MGMLLYIAAQTRLSVLIELCHVLREAIEAAGPAAAVPVAFLDRLERNLTERHAGLAAFLGEGHRHQGFQAALALFLPGEGEDQALGRYDLAEHAAQRQLLTAFDRAQAAAPDAAGPGVHLELGGRVVPWTPPVLGEAGVGPGFEHQLARRIEHAGDDELAFGRLDDGRVLLRHGLSLLRSAVTSRRAPSSWQDRSRSRRRPCGSC